MTTDRSNRRRQNPSVSGDAYDATYERRAAAGENVHGEADFVERFAPASVLDAGCGTGRVGRELARRGRDVVGVDLDPAMLATARQKAPPVAVRGPARKADGHGIWRENSDRHGGLYH